MTETEVAIRVDQRRQDRDNILGLAQFETNEQVEQGLRDAASLIDPDVDAPTGQVVISMTREDATELARILMEERMRLDKGGRRPVPQPRWGANVRIAHAVAAALDSTPEG